MAGRSVAEIAPLADEAEVGNIQTEFYNRLAAHCVADHVRHFVRRFPHSSAQVFEVGAGTGGTSAFVLEALSDHEKRLRYFYTDIDPAFLQMARQQFGAAVPHLDFATYDIERPPESHPAVGFRGLAGSPATSGVRRRDGTWSARCPR